MEDLVIWGAGAIGGTIGAYLARAGQNPLLVDADKDHVAAMKGNGLKITGPIAEFATPLTRRNAGGNARADPARDARGEEPAHVRCCPHDRAPAGPGPLSALASEWAER
jgi:2-polyprenyl-6-methoxyphenol hydroxylase-like FAD-dependent oxidoreductase